jgi:ribose transport system ATP-binding protein
VITATGIEKSFGDVHALSGVSLKLAPGRVHALLGANGSGKSTMVKILTGVETPTAGAIEFDGEARRFSSPRDAVAAGVRVIHQEAPLINSITVAESVALFNGYPRHPSGRIAWRSLRRSVESMLETYGIPVRPDAMVGDLSVAERAMVATAIALEDSEGDVTLFILDEATASMAEDQADALLGVASGLAERGIAVLMITHRVPEVPAYAHDVSVLSNGKVIFEGQTEGLDEARLFGLLGAGRESSGIGERRSPKAAAADGGSDTPILELSEVSGGTLHGLSLKVGAGEIVGIAGAPESGAEAIPQLLSGLLERDEGTFRIDGKDLPRRLGPARTVEEGIAVIPADRAHDGGAMSLSIEENMLLPQLRFDWRGWGEARRRVVEMMNSLDVRPANPKALLGVLSGGNQQKSIIGKWFMLGPRVMVFEDPTSGVDPGARLRIFDAIREASDRGIAVLFLTTEPTQYEALCDRLVVLQGGRIGHQLQGDNLNNEEVMKWLAK